MRVFTRRSCVPKSPVFSLEPLEHRRVFAIVGHWDLGFGDVGAVDVLGPTRDLFGSQLALQKDGKVLVLATVGDEGGNVYRFNPDGTPDASFGTGGVVGLPQAMYSSSYGHDLLVLDDGRFVVMGSGDCDHMAARFNADGSLDQSFGEDGTTCLSSAEQIYGVDRHGGILMGRYGIWGEGDVVVTRLLPDGTEDGAFGNDGSLVLHDANDVKLDAHGRILTWLAKTSSDVIIRRYTSDGVPDTAWGENGVVRVPGSEGAEFFDWTLGGDGEIFLSGDDLVADPVTGKVHRQSFLSRVNADGSRDVAFGESGGAAGGRVFTSGRYYDDSQGGWLNMLPDGDVMILPYGWHSRSRWNGQMLGLVSSADGSVRGRFDLTHSSLAGWDPMVFNSAIAPDGDLLLLVNLARWQGDGVGASWVRGKLVLMRYELDGVRPDPDEPPAVPTDEREDEEGEESTGEGAGEAWPSAESEWEDEVSDDDGVWSSGDEDDMEGDLEDDLFEDDPSETVW